MPIAGVTGRADVMSLLDEHVFFFTTFGGETLSLAAAQATINELRAHNVPADLARKGQVLMDGYNDIATELGLRDVPHCNGHPARGATATPKPIWITPWPPTVKRWPN